MRILFSVMATDLTVYAIIFSLLSGGNGLKTWISNTAMDNKLNWDGADLPGACDKITFPKKTEVAAYWNIKDISISGLTLPMSGEIIFRDDTNVRFLEEWKCPRVRDMRYTRTGVKGWLDPDNWMPETSEWVPHSERIPCAGEEINFPSDTAVAIQLPSILLPISDITFNNKVLDSWDWQRFLKTELGYDLFKGPDDPRNLPWRTDGGCTNKKCTCVRSAYAIRDGHYKDASAKVFQEAVCLYAMPKCEVPHCFFPVVPEGHCCGICGAVLKLEDRTDDGLDLTEIKAKVREELEGHFYHGQLQTYVGRMRNGNIQIVLVAENSDLTILSHALSSRIARKITDQGANVKIASKLSGLTFWKYLFNSISGIVFGTLLSVVILFAVLYYMNVIHPNKQLNLGGEKPFVFARFDNTLNEDVSDEGLHIESRQRDESRQAFDNPIYSEDGPSPSEPVSGKDVKPRETEISNVERTGTQEYHNLVYDDLEKSESLDIFNDEKRDGEENENEFENIML